MNIRLATINDCEACVKLSEIPELKDVKGEYMNLDYLKEFIDADEMFFVAEENNEIIGYILGEPMKGNVAFVGLLAVNAAVRGKGVGKALLKAFREKCDEKGLMYRLLYAPAFNSDTIAFYKKQGFVAGKQYVAFAEDREK